MHRTLPLLLSAALGCTPETHRSFEDSGAPLPEAEAPWDGMEMRPHPAGQLWRWPAHPGVEVLLVPTEVDIWTMGVYLRTPSLRATWSAREWTTQAGWVPLLLVWPDPERGAAAAAGDTLSLPVVGSGEHGCDPQAQLSITMVSGAFLEVTIEGVPYLTLPPAGVVEVDAAEAGPVALAALEGDVVVHGAQALSVEGGPMDGLTLSADRPLPWLQLQAHTDFIEIDMDHSCEDAAWHAAGAPTLRLTVPLESVEP